MTQTVILRHHTVYRFDQRVRLGPHLVRLHPVPTLRTRLLSYAITLTPAPMTFHWHHDPLANRLARASFDAESDALEIDVTLALELTPYNPFDFLIDAAAVTWPFAYPPGIARELTPYSHPIAALPWLASTLAGLTLVAQPSIGLLVALNQRVHALIRYATRLEPGIQDPAVTIDTATGSCRDVAWLMVLAARALGFAARFVSGYLVQLVDPDAPIPGLTEDIADLHAWMEAYLPGAGWIGFDATSGLVAGSGHVPLAAAAHPECATPIDGTSTPAISTLDTAMTVTRQ